MKRHAVAALLVVAIIAFAVGWLGLQRGSVRRVPQAHPPAAPAGEAQASDPAQWCKTQRQAWSASEPLPLMRGPWFKGVVLPEAAAPWVLCQCSRVTPGPGTGYWTPAMPDIAELEDGLPAYVRENAQPGVDLKTEVRQYLGVLRGAHRAIYVNLFPEPDPAEPHGFRTDAMLVCDGGAQFFGVEYDLDAHRFTHIAFNGEA